MASRPAMGIEEIIRRKISAIRQWKKTHLYKKHSNWKFQFSVMTYNILSQTALDNHRYMYRKCNPSFLREEYRVDVVLPEILQSRSDIVCLQEVEDFVYEARLKNVLGANGFGSVFMKRTHNKTDGCAIFWRQEKFQLVDQNGIEFRDRDNPILNRDNVGLIAVLKPNHRNAGDVLLHVATTHLLYNPRRGDVKLSQLRWLIAELERMALIDVRNNVRRYQPVILCGDFNIQPHSPLYKFIETGHINVANTMSGDLSGQLKKQNAGREVRFESLLLDSIGISNASRFEEDSRKGQKLKTPTNQKVQKMSQNLRVQNMPPKQQIQNITVVSNINSKYQAYPVPLITCDPRLNCPVQFPPFVHNHPLYQRRPNHISSTVPPASHESKIDSSPIASTKSSPTVDSAEDSSTVASTKGSSTVDSAKDSATAVNNKESLTEDGAIEIESTKYSFTHDFNFVPVYKFHNMSEGSIPITSLVGDDSNTVDHIFYNVDSKKDNRSYHEGILKLLSWYTLLTKEDLQEVGGLPNAGMGSDHICLGARFAINL